MKLNTLSILSLVILSSLSLNALAKLTITITNWSTQTGVDYVIKTSKGSQPTPAKGTILPYPRYGKLELKSHLFHNQMNKPILKGMLNLSNHDVPANPCNLTYDISAHTHKIHFPSSCQAFIKVSASISRGAYFNFHINISLLPDSSTHLKK